MSSSGAEVTRDALSGRYRIFQLREGHRFSTDDLLVAWYGTSHAPSVTRFLDLGSGVGSVAMVTAWRLPRSNGVAIEAQEQSLDLLARSLAFNGLAERVEVRAGDFRDAEVRRDLGEFELVLGSPPYFPLGSGPTAEHPQKQACRFELRGTIADYARVAAEHLAPAGRFACVFPVEPPHQLERVRAAAQDAGLVIVLERWVSLKEGERPLLGLFILMRADDLPEAGRGLGHREPDLIIRRADGRIHPEYAAAKMAIGFGPG